jgi:predicted RNA methylase
MKSTPKSKSQLLTWYFDNLHLQPSQDPEEFLVDLEQKYGNRLVNQLVSILDARDNDEDDENLYSFKNHTLSFSLDFAKYSADLYGTFLKWFISREFSPPARLLDLGCDNGIITCFYGLLFPNTEIIGVDICENAIRAATELALHFHLQNVKYITADMTDLSQFPTQGTFDIIVSLRSIQEIYGYFPRRPFGLSNSRKDSISDSFLKMSAISRLLRNDKSIFVTCERLTGLDQRVFYAEALRQAGLFIDFAQSETITFHELGELQEMPVFIASQNECSKHVHEELANFYRRSTKIILEPGYEYEGPVAEVIFTEVENKRFLKGLQIIDNEGIKTHYELWGTPKLLIRYQWNTAGYTELHILSLEAVDIAKQGLGIVAAMNKKEQISYYDQPIQIE